MEDLHRASTVVLRSPMLRLCSSVGCTVIVFGGGTCVEHDTVRIDRLLRDALAGLADPAADEVETAGSSGRRTRRGETAGLAAFSPIETRPGGFEPPTRGLEVRRSVP